MKNLEFQLVYFIVDLLLLPLSLRLQVTLLLPAHTDKIKRFNFSQFIAVLNFLLSLRLYSSFLLLPQHEQLAFKLGISQINRFPQLLNIPNRLEHKNNSNTRLYILDFHLK